MCIILTISAEYSNSTFPSGFSFGAATSAYQIEGAWNEDSKGETIWDHWVHSNPSKIADNNNADVACDSYHKYKEDVALLADLNLTHYRFSMAWSRILPSGFNNEISLKGILYYQSLISELQKHNITPIVTMYHWDLPESIQDLGGWTNKKIIGYFKDYATILFENFPTVKHWITINEPKEICISGYGQGSKAPFINQSGEADYLCVYHTVLAHAAVYNLYKEKFSKSEAKLSMAVEGAWNVPASNGEDDKNAAERKRLFDYGIYVHPLVFGDWPKVVIDRVSNRSKHFASSRLPSFTEDEKKSIIGTLDFLALNFYDTKMVANDDEANPNLTSFDNDLRVKIIPNGSWTITEDGNAMYPNGLRSYLSWVKDTYNNPEIFITENGIGDDGSTTDDLTRIYYLAGYLSAVLDSINKDNVTVTGYTMWSLLDNFEWTDGYRLHFGLYSVNFNDTKRTRTPKKSVEYYKQIIKDRKIPAAEPNSANLNSPGIFVVFATAVLYLLMKF